MARAINKGSEKSGEIPCQMSTRMTKNLVNQGNLKELIAHISINIFKIYGWYVENICYVNL